MASYSIGEVADRSGFSASALRFYEQVGLVEPAGRTRAGYRVYDERVLERLALVARAKQLGCSLEEIAELVLVWDEDRCAPVQRRLHDLVTAGLASASRQAAELTTFIDELRAAAVRLGGEPIDGPCRDGCACLPPHDDQAASIACTLDEAAQPARLGQWRDALAGATSRTALPDGIRVDLGDTDVGRLGALVVDEQRCCPFFRFTITVDGRGVGLEVRAPEEAVELVRALFGAAVATSERH